MAKIGSLEVNTPNGVKELPIYEISDFDSEVNDLFRVKADGNVGAVPLTETSNAAMPYLRIKTERGVMGVHDSPTLLTVITSGLEARYNFEDDSDTSTALDSQNNNDASISGAKYTINSSIESLAMDFDGVDDQLNLPDGVFSEFNTGISLSFWIEIRDGSGDAYVVDFRGDYDSFVKFNQNGSKKLRHQTYDGSASNNYSKSLNTNQRYHVVLTYSGDGGTSTWYINGSEGNSSGSMGTRSTSSNNLVAANQSSDSHCDCIIDDFRIYNRVLSSSEVSSIYNKSG